MCLFALKLNAVLQLRGEGSQPQGLGAGGSGNLGNSCSMRREKVLSTGGCFCPDVAFQEQIIWRVTLLA